LEHNEVRDVEIVLNVFLRFKTELGIGFVEEVSNSGSGNDKVGMSFLRVAKI
jgi:hypothetical protein